MIYLDNAATTPVRPEVVEVIHHAMVEFYGNPSSIYQLGKTVKHELMLAKQAIAQALEVSWKDIYFTSGATEANNWALRSQIQLSQELYQKGHIVASNIEHSAVKNVLEEYQSQGIDVTFINPNDHGQFDVQDFLDATREDTMGWVAMAVNNELGSILPIKELGQAAKNHQLWFHVDAVQAFGHVDMSDILPYCTSTVSSGHKFGAPKGIGLLIYQPWNEAMYLKPMIVGGGQEDNKRSGTENIPYILGYRTALELAIREQAAFLDHAHQLRQQLISQLQAKGIDFQINGDLQNYAPHITNIWFKGCPASQLLIQLDLQGICISAGSACSAGSVSESRILKAYYPDQIDRQRDSIRISFSLQTTTEEITEFVNKLKPIIERMSNNGN